MTKVRILPVGTVPRRKRGDLRGRGEDGVGKMDWEGWARHVSCAGGRCGDGS